MSQREPTTFVDRLAAHGEACAVAAHDATLTFAQLLEASALVAQELLDGERDLNGERVCFLVPPSAAYVATLVGIWRAGGIAVPLCVSHPPPELAHVLDDCTPSCAVVHPSMHPLLAPLAQARGMRLLTTRPPEEHATEHEEPALPVIEAARGALLIYTSGTTGKPKGALTTHAILSAQIRSIVRAWEITPSDRILHVLPLHHLHGVLNALLSPLFAGACCEILPRFEASEVFARLSSATNLTLFMAVPTIYAKLTAAWDAAPPSAQLAFTEGTQRLRLMISGSAALPVSMLERFAAISGHVLLERYGMTEIGMGLGNPLRGERRPGSVGMPFPDVEVRLLDEKGHAVATDGEAGALEVRGPSVFREYWNKPEATQEVFTSDGWFRTGDVAVREGGYYRLLGRSSVDILKTGGFKVSALEIEESLREHPAIADVCVVGVEDETWGQRVAAAAILHPGHALDLEVLRAWAKDRLAAYKVPSLLRVVAELPRNAMGKVQKPEARKLFSG